MYNSVIDTTKRKLNVLGLARGHEELMSHMKPEVGNLLVSIDLSSGEPTATSHYSKDLMYNYASFNGVGKEPYYSDQGVLMIDDIYLMTMSQSPIGKEYLQEMYDTFKVDGDCFSKAWVSQYERVGADGKTFMRDGSDIIKEAMKKMRKIHKILCLGIGYGMGARKMVRQAKDNGFDITFKQAKAFHKAYWNLFKGVRRFADRLQAIVERDRVLLNEFGFRMTPEPHKAFNYYIQSTISGVMHAFRATLMGLAPYAFYIGTVHDELLIEIPEDKVNEFRDAKDQATKQLNRLLGWSVDIRTGFEVGTNWYEAK
jgi:hypothetical protein